MAELLDRCSIFSARQNFLPNFQMGLGVNERILALQNL